MARRWLGLQLGASNLSNDNFIVAGRHTMGVFVLMQIEMQHYLWGVGNAGRLNHVMACDKTKVIGTVPHDVSATA